MQFYCFPDSEEYVDLAPWTQQ